MNIGFVYILFNAAFPKLLKIGRTARTPYERAAELSRSTGVPEPFVVLYDAFVADANEVETLLHEQLAPFRSRRRKEFFGMPPKDAILALQSVALRFPVPVADPGMTIDMLPYFHERFPAEMDPTIVGLRFLQLPGACCLEVDRRTGRTGRVATTRDSIPHGGLDSSDRPTRATLAANDALLRSCDEYDWINIASVFRPDAVQAIVEEWQGPGGRLEAEHGRTP